MPTPMDPSGDGPPAPTTAFNMERRWLPDAEGGLTSRVACTDVQRSVTGASACDFDWGNAGPGAYELALNLLEAALLAMSHKGPRSAALGGTCFTLALILRGNFVASFIAVMPDEGGSIGLQEIVAWIERETLALDPATRAFLAPRYWLDGRRDEHWSFPELLQIVAEPLTVAADGIYAGTRRVAVPADPHPLSTASWETQPI